MVCAAQNDPVAAVVLHSGPADIEMVIVDGIVRKRHWMLEDVNTGVDANQMWNGGDEIGGKLTWKNVSRELIKMQVDLQKKVDKLDMDAAKKSVIKGFYIDESMIVDKT
jgi:hypothetical protein